jgi:hypothetical protein
MKIIEFLPKFNHSHFQKIGTIHTLQHLLKVRHWHEIVHKYDSPSVFRIRTLKFLGLTDPDLFVKGTDPDSVPSITKQKKSKKNLNFYCFYDLFICEAI